MASRRAARGTRRHRVLDLPVPAHQRGQGSRHGRCRDLGRGSGHRIGRRRRAQARRPEPFRDGGADHAPGVAVLVAIVAAAIVAAAVTFAVVILTAASGSIIIFATATGPAAGSGANFAATVVTATVEAEIIAAIIIATVVGAADHGAADHANATAHAQAVTLPVPVPVANANAAAAGQLTCPGEFLEREGLSVSRGLLRDE